MLQIRNKKGLARLLAVFMLIVLSMASVAGCGTKQEEPQKQQTDQKEQNDQKDTSEQNEGEDNTVEKVDTGEIILPLSEEKAELSLWTTWQNSYLESLNEIPSLQEMEERTNVHINYIEVPQSQASEKFGLMLSSGDFQDIIFSGSYPGGITKGVDDGILLDLTDYVEDYLPNYLRWCSMDEDVMRSVKTDDGRFIGIYMLHADFDGLKFPVAWHGLAIRQDWLDRLGLETPVTIDDWTNVLTRFKNEIGCESPLTVGPKGSILSKAFLTAYGVTDEFYMDGRTVKYGPAEPGYKDYLAQMAQWYADGLLDKNFTTAANPFKADDEQVANGKVGAFPAYTPNLATGMQIMGYPVEEGFYVSGVQAPVLNEGDKIEYRVPQSLADNMYSVITTSCKDVELAAKWLDYQYTKDGMLENCLGVEGQSYIVKEDGSYEYTDLITNNPEGLTITDAIACNTRMGIGSMPGLYNAFKDTVIVDEEQFKGNTIWMKDGLSMCMPAQRSLTEEEGATFNLKYTDIETRASEYTIHVITGVESVDTFDDFVEELYAIGLKECLEIQQAACDRFYAR